MSSDKAAVIYNLEPGRVYRITHPMLFFTFTDQWRMLAVDEVVLVYRTDIGLGICHLFGSDGSVGTAYVDVLRNNCAPLVLD